MLTTAPTSAIATNAVSSIRRHLRAPLHQIISYAEVIAEESESHPDPRVLSCLTLLILKADACLKAISTPTSVIDTARLAEGTESLRDDLLDLHGEMATALEQLQSACENQAPPNLRSDLQKLHVAVRAYEEAVKQSDTTAMDVTSHDSNGAASQTTARIGPLRGLLLVVDDNEGNRDVLSRRLLRDGCEVLLAESGRQALRMAQRYDFDLILLDIMMPLMDGYAVLAELKRSGKAQHVPVIMISAVDEIESVVRCIDLGADDYLYKPFNPVLLRARVRALLERNRLRQEEQRKTLELTSALVQLQAEREKSDELLRNILPFSIAEELRSRGAVEPRYFEDVTIVFTDFVNFTLLTEELPTEDLVHILNRYFTAYDEIVLRYKLEKLKTIGDCYMFVGGMPERTPSHPVDAVLAAMEMVKATQDMAEAGPVNWQLRVGIHTGPVAAGVVGTHKFAYDVWGDAVNLSSRMEANSEPGRINLSASTYTRIKDFFSCEKRGLIRIKDGRDIQMHFVKTIAPGFLDKRLSPATTFMQRYRTYFKKELALPAYLSTEAGLKES